MSCRFGCTLLAMTLGLLPSLGCANGRLGVPIAASVPCPSQPGDVASGELTASQAAALCWTTADALEKKGYAAEAIRQYENARNHNPQLGSVSRRLAVLYDLQGDSQRAETEYMRAQREQPGDAELLNDLGYFHYRHDHLSTAETWLRNAVTADPHCGRAWINLGQVLARQGRMEESYQAFAHALRPAEAYSNLGVLLAKQGRTPEARTALQHALQLDPTLKQPQAILSALPAAPVAPALLPLEMTRTPPPHPTVPRTPPTPSIVQSPPQIPAPPPAVIAPPRIPVPPSIVMYSPSAVPLRSPPLLSAAPTLPPQPARADIPPSLLTAASTPPPPPAAAQTPPCPLPIIRIVREPSAVASTPMPPAVPPPPPVSASPPSPTMPAIVPNAQPPLPPAPLALPAPQPAKPFILHVSPPTPASPKPEVRQPEVIITDCQGEEESTPP